VTRGTDEPPSRTLVHHPGDPWEADADLVVGAVLAVRLHPAGGYRWSPITTTDSTVATVSGAVDEDGAARFTVRALRPGRTELAATTEHRGDRFGPPTRRWVLRLHVEDGAP
jgi:hypothetical protein